MVRCCLYATICAAGCCLAAGGCYPLPTVPGSVQSAQPNPTAGLPGKYTHRLAPYVFHADFEIPSQSPVLRELAGLRDQVERELRLTTSNAIIQVYLFQDSRRYDDFMKKTYPDLPARRAFFVAQPRALGREDLNVYTYWGERVAQDLRHELTHALLHSVLKDVPLWLDEGLAEFFEVPRGQESSPKPLASLLNKFLGKESERNDFVNYQHLEKLVRDPNRSKPDLSRLEKLDQVRQMTLIDYREAWAWVYLMLRSTPEAKKVLVDYLQELRTNPQPGPLRPRLARVFFSPEDQLERRLAELDRCRPAAASR
jgi:hypothetical protein